MRPTNDGMRKCGRPKPANGGMGGRWREQAVRSGMLNGVGCIGTRNSFGGDDGVKAGRSGSVCSRCVTSRSACLRDTTGVAVCCWRQRVPGYVAVARRPSMAEGKHHKILFSFFKRRTMAASLDSNTHSRYYWGMEWEFMANGFTDTDIRCVE